MTPGRRPSAIRAPIMTAVREQIAELKFAEPRQRQVEAAELQFSELEAEKLLILTRVQR